jgi:hypothetical protein
MSKSSKYRLRMVTQSTRNGCRMWLIYLALYLYLGHSQNWKLWTSFHSVLSFLVMWTRLRVWPVFDPYRTLLLTMYLCLSAIVRTEWVHYQCLEDALTEALLVRRTGEMRAALFGYWPLQKWTRDLFFSGPFLKEPEVMRTSEGEGWSLASRASDEAPWKPDPPIWIHGGALSP